MLKNINPFLTLVLSIIVLGTFSNCQNQKKEEVDRATTDVTVYGVSITKNDPFPPTKPTRDCGTLLNCFCTEGPGADKLTVYIQNCSGQVLNNVSISVTPNIGSNPGAIVDYTELPSLSASSSPVTLPTKVILPGVTSLDINLNWDGAPKDGVNINLPNPCTTGCTQ